jgi:type II secretory pathway pseudopilin PulG
MPKREAGFTVLEVLVVGGIIGIITAIAIVSYTNAINRARQKRTVNDIRVIAQAWEARASDTQTYQVAGYTFPVSNGITHETLVSALRPTYLRDIPSVDGWRRPLQFSVQPGTGSSPGEYAIRSAGRDGRFDAAYADSGPTTDPDCDIVWANGSFVSYPDVVQGQ